MKNTMLYREYFKLHPGPVMEEEVEKFRETHPDFPRISTVRCTRTRLINAGVLQPVEGETIKKKKREEGSFLGSYLRTKKAARESIYRQRQINL